MIVQYADGRREFTAAFPDPEDRGFARATTYQPGRRYGMDIIIDPEDPTRMVAPDLWYRHKGPERCGAFLRGETNNPW